MVSTLLPIVLDKRGELPPSIVCCIGYELSKWRASKLSKFVLDAIPEFVLTDDELGQIQALSPYSTLEKAIPAFTNAANPSSGGEVGELLAHRILVRDFGTRQLVKRMHYKMRSRDAVTGFDIVHFKASGYRKIELWLGEAKFFSNRSNAISKSISNLRSHLEAGILTERKSFIGPKIPASSPYYDRLQWLFHPDTYLDEIVSRMVVPVFIAADTKSTTIGTIPSGYDANIATELDDIVAAISKQFGTTLTFAFIYVPLNDKKSFDDDFHKRLKAFA